MIDIDKIKEYIQDSADKNILLDYTEQFEEELVEMIIPMVYEEAKILYPAIASKPKTLPDIVMMYGVISKLMESESFLQLRNEVQYSDSNANVNLSSKSDRYQQKAEIMQRQHLRLLEGLATASFMNNAWGSVHSNADDFVGDALDMFGHECRR